jgi:hypothetical protein
MSRLFSKIMEEFTEQNSSNSSVSYESACYGAYTVFNAQQVTSRYNEIAILAARGSLEKAILAGEPPKVIEGLQKALTESEVASSEYDLVKAIAYVKTADAGFAAARKAGKIKIPDGVDTDLFYIMTMLKRELMLRAGWWYEVFQHFKDGTIIFTSDTGHGEKALITLKKEGDNDPFFKITVTLCERDEEAEPDANPESENYLSPPRCIHKAMTIRTGTPWDVRIAASDIMQVLVKCDMDKGALKDHLTDDVVIPMF